jgi:hypothetical protein
VPAGHIVHFILDAVEQRPINDFRINERGSLPAAANSPFLCTPRDPPSGITFVSSRPATIAPSISLLP